MWDGYGNSFKLFPHDDFEDEEIFPSWTDINSHDEHLENPETNFLEMTNINQASTDLFENLEFRFLSNAEVNIEPSLFSDTESKSDLTNHEIDEIEIISDITAANCDVNVDEELPTKNHQNQTVQAPNQRKYRYERNRPIRLIMAEFNKNELGPIKNQNPSSKKMHDLSFLVENIKLVNLTGMREPKIIIVLKLLEIIKVLKEIKDVDAKIKIAEIYYFLGHKRFNLKQGDSTKDDIYWFGKVFKTLTEPDGKIIEPRLVILTKYELGNRGHRSSQKGPMQWFREALAIYRDNLISDPLLEAKIYIGLGKARAVWTEGTHFQDWFKRAIEIVMPLNHKNKNGVLGMAYNELGKCKFSDSTHKFHGDWFFETVRILEGTPSKTLIKAYLELGRLRYWSSKYTPLLSRNGVREYWYREALDASCHRFDKGLYGQASVGVIRGILEISNDQSAVNRAWEIVDDMKIRGIEPKLIDIAKNDINYRLTKKRKVI